MGKTFAELEKEFAQERAYAKEIREAQERKREKKEMIRAIRTMKVERKYGPAIKDLFLNLLLVLGLPTCL